MTTNLGRTALLASVAALALLAGCAHQNGPSGPQAVSAPYNPPGAALAALPPGEVTWYHVHFANNSYRIDEAGRQAIASAAGSMNGNALTAVVIGKTDAAGTDSGNMRLSEQRARAVRNELIRTGEVGPARIETRWTGDRHPNDTAGIAMADINSGREVVIGVH